MGKPVCMRYLVPLALPLLLLACGSEPKEKVVATVNGASITEADLRHEVAGYGKNNQVTLHSINDQLKLMIEQKLLIQEAVKMGLSDDPKFAETIKAYWEQTIIRNLIDAKTRELSNQVYVTDQEMDKEYGRMGHRLKIRAVRGARSKQEADALVLQMQGGGKVKGEEAIGPLFYEDVKGSPLANAFDMKDGQIASFPAEGEYVVIGVVGRESVELPSRQEFDRRVRESVLLQKRQRALAGWIAAVKSEAKIQIDEKELRSMAHE